MNTLTSYLFFFCILMPSLSFTMNRLGDLQGPSKRQKSTYRTGDDEFVVIEKSRIKHLACTFEGCGWAFACQSDLIRHTKTHTGERPYACVFSDCDKNFSRQEHLTRHMKTHIGEGRYICKVKDCNKAFPRLVELNRHMKTHTGERPYICDVKGCSKTFAQHGNFIRHMRIHERTNNSDVKNCQQTPCDYPSKAASCEEEFMNTTHEIYKHIPRFEYLLNSEDCIFDITKELPSDIFGPYEW